ncbi:hypothetical protein Syun_018386 [Stephania yunnanensis]|uniref:Uncharacterized protein n=1 Tax=Stephania yunnanensis TaxID=152371 RepID=A0AAP0IS98_9MAGN
MAKYWWANSRKDRGIHWCDWEKMAKAKDLWKASISTTLQNKHQTIEKGE